MEKPKPDSSASVTHIIDSLIETAYSCDASDIHIDPLATGTIVKFRIDGLLVEHTVVPKDVHHALISRIKILARLRTDEHSIPQDGRFRKSIGKDFMDIRVSIMPTYHGENAVLRLLKNSNKSLELSHLGFSDADTTKILKALEESHGMIIATGPTGAGKTTTLYTLLRHLTTGTRSIITLEDPIEYAIDGIRQIQIQVQRGFSFPQGLRSIVRQDPNVIMVGEIRDEETARISIQTALTGHKLLSTLHTSDAATAIPRFLDMGIEPYLLASTLKLVIAQRLVRKLCVHCKKTKCPTDAEKEILQKHTGARVSESCEIFIPVGCKKCFGAGYLGRVGLYEVLVVTDAIRKGILDEASAQNIGTIALREGMDGFGRDGFSKVMSGITSIEEVLASANE